MSLGTSTPVGTPKGWTSIWLTKGCSLSTVVAQRTAFLDELFIADARADPQGTLFRDFFQTDREGRRKGIVVIDLKDLP